jgi:hypothetical protein
MSEGGAIALLQSMITTLQQRVSELESLQIESQTSIEA